MRRKKLSDVVALPLVIDLAFLTPAHGGTCLYQLAAVCLHSGTAHGGHYHAYTQDPCSGTWRDCNDSRVQVLSQSQRSALFGPAEGEQHQALHSSDAYFLLYRRAAEGTTVPAVQDGSRSQRLLLGTFSDLKVSKPTAFRAPSSTQTNSDCLVEQRLIPEGRSQQEFPKNCGTLRRTMPSRRAFVTAS